MMRRNNDRDKNPFLSEIPSRARWITEQETEAIDRVIEELDPRLVPYLYVYMDNFDPRMDAPQPNHGTCMAVVRFNGDRFVMNMGRIKCEEDYQSAAEAAHEWAQKYLIDRDGIDLDNVWNEPASGEGIRPDDPRRIH